ncbi:MAG: DNA polymerase III subunit alpha [Simkaniaceae bacterium]
MTFIPLHVHSQYSILNSTASIKDLVQKASFLEMPALALTDFGNMFGTVDFFKTCRDKDIKPIIGLEIMLAPNSCKEKKKIGGRIGYPLILLAKNQKGYQNLCRLSSAGYLEGFYYVPRIDKELLKSHSEGLICLSGPLSGLISQLAIQEKLEELQKEIHWFQAVFKDSFFFEVGCHEMSEENLEKDGVKKESWLLKKYQDYIRDQQNYLKVIFDISKKYSVPCAATNEVHYLEREDWLSHEILLNVQSGQPREIWEKDPFGKPKDRILNPKRDALASHEFYFKTSEEMRALFHEHKEAIEQTAIIASQCEVVLNFKKRFYPVFYPPSIKGKNVGKEERERAVENYLKELCEKAIEERYDQEKLAKIREKYSGQDPLEVVRKRLDYELEIILSKGMCDYLLIVHDFISWAKANQIPVGPGRGSGAGSIILYLIGITDIEPLRFNLFFERFINPERLSYPDIDVDICMERRSEVIDYTIQKYGSDKVAQIITFGTMKAKMAIKDVGRVLSIPLSKVNAIAKLVPEDPNMTLEKALDMDPELLTFYQEDSEARRIIDIAKKVEGSIRNTGIHAAGIIVSEDPLTDHIPVCTSKDSEILVTQYSMKPVEAVGMLKIDFLGLKTLTSIQKAVNAAVRSDKLHKDWRSLPLDDANAFSLLNQGKTLGVFQLESAGMKDLARQLHLDKFEEIIAAIALYRPGPMEMIPSFINRKLGKEEIEYDHALMKDILEETYGIMVYQEQVMQIASKLAGYSLGEGDVLRRAMGKKDREEMAKQREKFRKGAMDRGLDESLAMAIFDKVEKFASYGFNKSHAAAYGYLSYVTAYLKANYPSEWLAALMTCDMDDLAKISKFIRECQALNLKILPPDVNESDLEFVATEGGIRFSLAAIKGVGRGVVESIVSERKKNGLFTSLYNFVERIDTKKVGKKTVENLIEAGCFDFTGWTRKALLTSIETMYDIASKKQKEKSKGILDFFEVQQDHTTQLFEKPPSSEEIAGKILLAREKELLGFYLTGHPMEEYSEIIQKIGCSSLHTLEKAEKNGIIKAAFIIESITSRFASRSGRKFAILTISDGMEQFELPIWPEMYEKHSHQLVESQLFFSILQYEKEEGEIKLGCKWLCNLNELDEGKLQEAEEAFDRAKDYLKKGQKKSMKKKEEVQKKKKIILKLDADQTRLSHILKLKKIFAKFPGENGIKIEFLSEITQTIGHLEVRDEWGIKADKDLQEHIQKYVPSFHSFHIIEE